MPTPASPSGYALWLTCVVTLACSSPPRPPPPTPTPQTVAAPDPDPDADGDGLSGSRDQCPAEPEDCDGHDDTDGCPDPDDDHDSVADVCDACPEEQGSPPDGCPHLVVIEQQNIRILSNPYFARNSAALAPPVLPLLDELVQVMMANPQLRRVAIEGHATRDERNARLLSQTRAQAVRDYLVAHGVDAARLETQALADTRPAVAPNEPRAAERNRRVEFRVLDVAERQPRTSRPRVVVPEGCPDHPPPPTRGPCHSSTTSAR